MKLSFIRILKDFQRDPSQPAYYFDLDGVLKFYTDLKNEKIDNFKILFPVKSFPNEYFLESIVDAVDGFDISNQKEYDLVQKFNKILWSSSPLNLFSQESKIISDISDLSGLKDAQMCSLRLNLDQSSRFGIPLSELENINLEKVYGLHVHNQSWKSTALEELYYFIKKLDADYNLGPIKAINLGGGFSSVPTADFLAGLRKICSLFPDKTFFIEPARMVMSPYGFLLGVVKKIQNIDSIQLSRVTTSISSLCHLRWEVEEKKVKFFSSSQSLKDHHYKKAVVVGETLFEDDILLKTIDLPPLGVGDIVMVSGVSSYAAVWNHSFNGVDKARLFFIKGGEIVSS